VRGRFQDQGGLFSYLSPEAWVPPSILCGKSESSFERC
jgi:hypothetical protein